jgi:phosphate transport system protein
MRIAFRKQLEGLTETLGEMCAIAGVAMDRATQALLEADLHGSEDIISDHARLTAMRRRAEDSAVALLALQAPVARDLRAVVSSLQNAADAERMGGLAVHVAETVRRRHPAHVLPETVNEYFAQMGRLAVEMGANAGDVVLSCDPRRAAQIRHDDDAMNELHRNIMSALIDTQWQHGPQSAVDVTLLARFYERFADHAVEIGRRVIFLATGDFTEPNAS